MLPVDARLLAVGGIEPGNMGSYWSAGVAGFGIGSALFRPGKPIEEIAANARRFVGAIRKLMGVG